MNALNASVAISSAVRIPIWLMRETGIRRRRKSLQHTTAARITLTTVMKMGIEVKKERFTEETENNLKPCPQPHAPRLSTAPSDST